MFKWLTRRMPPQHAVLRWTCLPQPERLLELAQAAARAGQVALQPADEFSAIITSIWINDVNKRTSRDRLPATLRAIAEALPNHGRRIRFLDLGASDGISTCDAVRCLREQLRVQVSAHAVDLHTRLIRYDGRWLSEYRTADGSPVLLRAGRIGLRLGRALAFRPAEACRATYLRSQRIRSRLRPALSIPLVHPLAAADPDITVSEADALQRHAQFTDAFDVVRISNLLNASYFSRQDIETIVGHAVTYLAANGLLAISKNVNSGGTTNECGSLWRRNQDGLTWVMDFNGGSELRSWLATFETPAGRSAQACAAA